MLITFLQNVMLQWSSLAASWLQNYFNIIIRKQKCHTLSSNIHLIVGRKVIIASLVRNNNIVIRKVYIKFFWFNLHLVCFSPSIIALGRHHYLQWLKLWFRNIIYWFITRINFVNIKRVITWRISGRSEISARFEGLKSCCDYMTNFGL